MNEDPIWKKIERYTQMVVLVSGAYKMLERSQENRLEIPKIKDITDRVHEIQEPCLELLVRSLNELALPIPIDEVREKLFEIIQKQYDASFETMITGSQDSQVQSAALVEARDELISNQYLREILNRIELCDGSYRLK